MGKLWQGLLFSYLFFKSSRKLFDVNILFSSIVFSSQYVCHVHRGGGVDAPWSADGGATIWLNNCQNSLKPLEVHTNHLKNWVFKKRYLALAPIEFCRGKPKKKITLFL